MKPVVYTASNDMQPFFEFTVWTGNTLTISRFITVNSGSLPPLFVRQKVLDLRIGHQIEMELAYGW